MSVINLGKRFSVDVSEDIRIMAIKYEICLVKFAKTCHLRGRRISRPEPMKQQLR